jgi:hypothetical protein
MLTLFSTPKPFRGHIEVIQRNALKAGGCCIPGWRSSCMGRHEPEVLRNVGGTKRVDFIFGRAQEIARTTLFVTSTARHCADAGVHRSAARRLLAWRARFLMVGRRCACGIRCWMPRGRCDTREDEAGRDSGGAAEQKSGSIGWTSTRELQSWLPGLRCAK